MYVWPQRERNWKFTQPQDIVLSFDWSSSRKFNTNNIFVCLAELESLWVNVQLNMSEGHTGVFLWCVISWFYFLWNLNLGNYSSWLVTWRFCVTCGEPELLTDIRDFNVLFYVILRCKSSEWLESSIESGLGVRFAIWSLDLAIRYFAFFKHCF